MGEIFLQNLITGNYSPRVQISLGLREYFEILLIIDTISILQSQLKVKDLKSDEATIRLNTSCVQLPRTYLFRNIQHKQDEGDRGFEIEICGK